MKRTPRENFVTIPQAPRYELNSDGVLRNRETGRILKWSKGIHKSKYATLYRDGQKKICASLPHLLWQLHGRIISQKRPVPVVISKGTRTVRFDSLNQCSIWLMKYRGLKHATVWAKLVHREKVIDGWDVHYCY